MEKYEAWLDGTHISQGHKRKKMLIVEKWLGSKLDPEDYIHERKKEDYCIGYLKVMRCAINEYLELHGKDKIGPIIKGEDHDAWDSNEVLFMPYEKTREQYDPGRRARMDKHLDLSRKYGYGMMYNAI